MKITGLFSELREKENMAKVIRIISDYENDDRVIKLLFHTPGDEKHISDRIPISNYIGEFRIPNSLLDQPGILKVQACAYGDEELLEKSPVYEFKVRPSIDPDTAEVIDFKGLTSVETLLTHLDRLEEEKKVLYSEQELTTEEKELARTNIGIDPVAKENDMTLPVGMDAGGHFYTTPYDDTDVVKSVNGETVDENGNVSIFIPSKLEDMTEDDMHKTVTSAQIELIDNSVQVSEVTRDVAEGSDLIVTSGGVYTAVAQVYSSVHEMIGDVDSVLHQISELIGGDGD